MICPKCKREYDEGFTVCAVDGTELVPAANLGPSLNQFATSSPGVQQSPSASSIPIQGILISGFAAVVLVLIFIGFSISRGASGHEAIANNTPPPAQAVPPTKLDPAPAPSVEPAPTSQPTKTSSTTDKSNDVESHQIYDISLKTPRGWIIGSSARSAPDDSWLSHSPDNAASFQIDCGHGVRALDKIAREVNNSYQGSGKHGYKLINMSNIEFHNIDAYVFEFELSVNGRYRHRKAIYFNLFEKHYALLTDTDASAWDTYEPTMNQIADSCEIGKASSL